MNKKALIVGVIVIALLLVSVIGFSNTSKDDGTANVFGSIKSFFTGDKTAVSPTPTTTMTSTGNGSLSGAHYNLNIIGVSKEKSTDMTGGDGHRIFVSLGSAKSTSSVQTKILLSQSTDGSFKVTDANGTDGSAGFQLPVPGTYSIWARPLGKPGGTATMTTCGTDITTGEELCSTSNEVFVRGTGKSSFRNVTTALTSIDIDSDLTAVIDACGGTTVGLFDPCLQGYFWSYDNNGLRILQLRFYPSSSPLSPTV